MYDLMAPKLFGLKYKKLFYSIIVALAIGMGLKGLEYTIDISDKMLLFMNMAFSGAIMLQYMTSLDNGKYLRDVFAMPFDRKDFILGYAASMGLYVIGTKTSVILAVFYAFSDLTVMDIVMLAVESVAICLGSMVVYACTKQRFYISTLVLIVMVASCFVITSGIAAIVFYAVVAALFETVLLTLDPYCFMVIDKSGLNTKSEVSGSASGGSNLMVSKYILRYLMSNKSNLLNIVLMLGFASVLVFTMKDAGVSGTMYIGLAMITVNTPLQIIVSASRDLRKKLKSMPNEVKGFYIPYATTLFVIYLVSYALFLVIMFVLKMEIPPLAIPAAIVFALEASAGTSFMEYKYPLTKWSVETDLWHHPRKYIVPAVLILEAGLLML